MKFILNDERVTNSYGFRVKTSGIKLDRFLSNPICLNNHSNNTKDVLGNWQNTMVEGQLLTASPLFDTEDADGKEVVRKVEKGILKACSIGISFDPEHLVMEDGILTMQECELMEASICAVPSNASAVVLYNQQGEQLSEGQVKQICLSATTINPFKTNKPMKKLNAYLQLDEKADEKADETAVVTAVKGIEAKLTASQNENTALKAENEALKQAEIKRKKAEFSAEVDKAESHTAVLVDKTTYNFKRGDVLDECIIAETPEEVVNENLRNLEVESDIITEKEEAQASTDEELRAALIAKHLELFGTNAPHNIGIKKLQEKIDGHLKTQKIEL